MNTDEKHTRLASLLDDENFIAVVEYGYKNNLTPNVALNRIVSEWTEKDKIGLLKTTEKASSLNEIKKQLTGIEILVSDVYEFLEEHYSGYSN